MPHSKVKQPIRPDIRQWIRGRAEDQDRSEEFVNHLDYLGAESVRWRADRHLPQMSKVPLGTPRANGDTLDLPNDARPHGPKAWPILQIDTRLLYGLGESLPRSPDGILVLYTTGMSEIGMYRDYILRFYAHVLDADGHPSKLIRHTTRPIGANEGWYSWVGEPISLRPQKSLSYPNYEYLNNLVDHEYRQSAAFFDAMYTEYRTWRIQWSLGDDPFKGMDACVSAGIQMFGHPIDGSVVNPTHESNPETKWIVLLQVDSPRWYYAPSVELDIVKIDDGCCHLVCLVPEEDWARGNLDRMIMKHVRFR